MNGYYKYNVAISVAVASDDEVRPASWTSWTGDYIQAWLEIPLTRCRLA